MHWPWIFVGCFGASGAPGIALSQPCSDTRSPGYDETVEAIGKLAPALDTLGFRGTLNVTVLMTAGQHWGQAHVGLPVDHHVGSAVVKCRTAVLWTSREDSVAVHWVIATENIALHGTNLRDFQSALEDRPQPVFHTQSAGVRFPSRLDSLKTAAAAAVAVPEAARTSLWVLIDETGRALVVRLAASSGVRELDEAALRIFADLEYLPAKQSGKAVKLWYFAPIAWSHRNRPTRFL